MPGTRQPWYCGRRTDFWSHNFKILQKKIIKVESSVIYNGRHVCNGHFFTEAAPGSKKYVQGENAKIASWPNFCSWFEQNLVFLVALSSGHRNILDYSSQKLRLFTVYDTFSSLRNTVNIQYCIIFSIWWSILNAYLVI